jgi:signal transduction histidine kinase
LSILAAIFILTGVFKTLVFNTNLTFDFENVFNLDSQNLFAVTGVILLLIALFLFSHRMMMTIVKIGLNRHQRLIALGIATAVSIPLFFFVDFIIPPFYLLLIAFVFILVFDLFIDSGTTNFTWLVIWLVILSAFPSILLFRYNSFKDRLVRIAYAKELANMKDVIAEDAFGKLKDNIENNNFFKKDIPPYPFKLKKEILLKQIDEYYSSQSYLYYNYTFTVFGFDRYGNAVIEGQKRNKDRFDLEMESSESTKLDGLRYWEVGGERNAYLMEVSIPTVENPKNYLTLGFKFQRKRRDQSKVYTELLIDKPYKNLQHLHNYDYAIYKNNHRIDAEGNIYGNVLTAEELPKKGERKEIIVNDRSELIYKSEDGIVVIIGKQTEDYMKKAISLFSYIFSMFFAFILLFALINSSVKILPDSLKFYLVKKPSLKNKIQLSVIGLIIVSFIFIGFVTVWFFKSSSNDYHESRLERKTSSVKAGALHELSLIVKNNDSLFNLGQLNLEKLNISESLSQIHRMDVNLYDLSGKLINSSEEDIFNKGIVADQMGALAFNALSKQELSEYFQEKERIGKLVYKAAYIPLKVKDKTIAYLGLPYYSKQSKLRSDVTVFMSTLMNVYVFLLLIASGFAIAVANSITRPIAIIGEKLKQFKLGGRNEPLEWKNKDELGVLISEYNKMIKKLKESADKLAQSEREGAWREMAKQVAHEIKNPLTPMKLSIQYLLHAYKANPKNVEPLLQRVTSTLIEQIDNLAQIASEFSNFAKMPRAENQKININSLVSSVYDLFSKGVEMDISIHLPAEEFFVYADKNHLIRVLTNLMKNAEQSIPGERYGKIDVSLFQQENKAVIKVSDNGSGISDDKKDKVFVPNFTTKSSGTGLGLAISKNIIESVNGNIYFKTVVGVGTDFFVELPIVEINKLEKIEL